MTTACANRTILHATPTLLASGGAFTHSVSQLCNAICRVAEGTRLALVSRDFGGQSPAPVVNDVQRLLAGQQQRFDAVIQSFQPKTPLALIHQHGIWQQSMRDVSAFARSKRIPLVLSVHGMLSPTLLRHHPLQKKIDLFVYQRRDLKNAAALHATTQAEVAHIRAQRLRQPILFIPNGVPLPPAELTATHDPDKKERSVLCIARLHQPRELEELLQLWAKLRPQGWRLHIAAVEEAALQTQLRTQASTLGIDGSVQISGILFGLAHQHAYRSADLFLLPSPADSLGPLGIEALSYGLPLLTRTGILSSELEQAQCGWYAPDAAALAEALVQAIDSPERAAMGKRARALIERKYHWPQIGRDMLHCYSWLLGETSSRPDCVITTN